MALKLNVRTGLVQKLLLLILLCCSAGEANAQVLDGSDIISVVDSTDSRMVQVNSVLQEVFHRARANDYAVFYEYEFSYLRQEITLDQYLNGIQFRQQRIPNSDSVTALRIDSVQISDGRMAAYVTSTAGDGSDGSEPRHYPSVQTLYLENGFWIKPLSTRPHNKEEFDRKIESYRKAVERDEEMQQKDGGQ